MHTRGPILEETHYYPFGLVQQGISSHAAGLPFNRDETFQGQPFDEELGIDIHPFRYRVADPQNGRFWQVDPLAHDYVYNSTYAFSENKVTSHIELEGLESVPMHVPGYADARLMESVTVSAQWHGISSSMRSAMVNYQLNHTPPLLTQSMASLAPSFWQLWKGSNLSQPYGGWESKALYSSVNDLYIGLKTFASGPMGWSRYGMTDLAGDPVTYDQRMGAGIATLSLPLSEAVGVEMQAIRSVRLATTELSVAEQATNLSKRINRNSFMVGDLGDGIRMQYDFLGATHKGVPTPHVQMWKQNINPATGAIHYNKVSRFVIPMTQKHINYLENYFNLIGY